MIGPSACPAATMKRIHLLSCGQCQRQLDVTALHPGDSVQCVCDALHVVGPPKIVQVRGLACSRCGGVLGMGDTSCTYCHAALAPHEREETTLCPVCATRLPNASIHCNQCGAALRAAAVPALPSGGKCPRCRGGLRVHLLPDAEVIECGGADESTGCGGIWCTRDTFERLTQNVRRAVHRGEVGSPPGAPRLESLGAPEGAVSAYVPCPTCGELMQRRQFRFQGKASRIVLDMCRNHGVWFDQHELEGVLAFIRSSLAAGDNQATRNWGASQMPSASTVPKYRNRKRMEADGTSNGSTSIFGYLLDAISDYFMLP